MKHSRKPVTVSTNISKNLNEILLKIAEKEDRSRSYYLRQGLKNILENHEDYHEAKEIHDEIVATG